MKTHFLTIHRSAQFIKMRHKPNLSEIFAGPGLFTRPRGVLGGLLCFHTHQCFLSHTQLCNIPEMLRRTLEY